MLNRKIDIKKNTNQTIPYPKLEWTAGYDKVFNRIWDCVPYYAERNSVGKMLKFYSQFRPTRWVIGHVKQRLDNNDYRWARNSHLGIIVRKLKKYKIKKLWSNVHTNLFFHWERKSQIKPYFKATMNHRHKIFERSYWLYRYFFNKKSWFKLKFYTKFEKLKDSLHAYFWKFFLKKIYGNTKWVQQVWRFDNIIYSQYQRKHFFPQTQKKFKWLRIFTDKVAWNFNKIQIIKKRKHLIWFLRKYFYKQLYLKEKFFKKFKNFLDYNNFAENRLVQAVLKTGAIKNFKHACRHIKFGKIFVNNVCIRDINFETKPHDIIFVDTDHKYNKFRYLGVNYSNLGSLNNGGLLSSKRFKIFCLVDSNRNKHKKNIKKFRLISYYNYRLLSKCD